MSHGLFRLKSVEDTVGHTELKRTMGRSALLFFSVGSSSASARSSAAGSSSSSVWPFPKRAPP